MAGATRDAGRLCRRLLVMENLETFRALAAYAWIDRRGLDVSPCTAETLELPPRLVDHLTMQHTPRSLRSGTS